MTTLIAMVSPSFQYAKESNNTLSFANSCSHIQNLVKKNKYKNSIPSSVPVVTKKKEKLAELPWKKGLDHKAIEKLCVPVTLKSKTYNDTFVLKAGEDDWIDKIILIHGCPSNNKVFLHQIEAYLFCQYQVFAVDMPGYGQSTGKKQASKSDQVLVKDGPADFIQYVIKALELNNKEFNLCIGGYDWGAAIALKMCLKNSQNFKRVIAFHPSYNEEKGDELKSIKIPTLIQWVKEDQNHPWKKWEPLAKKIKGAQVDIFSVGKFKPGVP